MKAQKGEGRTKDNRMESPHGDGLELRSLFHSIPSRSLVDTLAHLPRGGNQREKAEQTMRNREEWVDARTRNWRSHVPVSLLSRYPGSLFAKSVERSPSAGGSVREDDSAGEPGEGQGGGAC